jgi:CHAT domain-containing protein
MDVQKALHAAQTSLMTKWEQPKYWGAFIASGM